MDTNIIDINKDTDTNLNKDINTDINTDLNTDINTDSNSNLNTDIIIDRETDINTDRNTDLNTDIITDSNTNLNTNKPIKEEATDKSTAEINTDKNGNFFVDIYTDLNSDKSIDSNTNKKTYSDINTDIKSDINLNKAIEEENTNKSTEDYFEDDKYNINLAYKKNNLELLYIEKNMTSHIMGKLNETQKTTFDYKCILGIDDEIYDEISNMTYYKGFLFILSTIYSNYSQYEIHNKIITLSSRELVRFDKELFDMINKIDQDFIKNFEFEKENYQYLKNDDKEKNNFIKFDFYQNGSYREIYKPISISQEFYNECKEILDIVLPKIGEILGKDNEINQEKKN